jgi:tetratricopeptide (TPR) repeat protein
MHVSKYGQAVADTSIPAGSLAKSGQLVIIAVRFTHLTLVVPNGSTVSSALQPETTSADSGDAARFASFARGAATIACILALYGGIVGFKLRAEHATAPGFLKEEFALQYRYARLVGEGKRIPRQDRKLQYPEGVRPHESLPLFMEHLTGHAYRWVHRRNPTARFDEVVVWVKALWSTLSVLACAALARLVFRDNLAAIAAAVLYGLSPAGMYRSVPSLAHEDFALPLLFGGLAGLVASVRGATVPVRLAGAAVTALLWLLAVLTWHFARFFLLAQAGALLIFLVVASPSCCRRLQIALAVTIAALAGAGVMLVHLRSTRFLLGLPFWSLVSVLVTATALVWAIAKLPLGRLGQMLLAASVAALALGTCAVVTLLSDSGSLYGHVWELLWAKLTHWTGKPVDPSRLSFDARILWTGSFHSPQFSLFLYQMWAALLASAAALVQLPRAYRAAEQPDARGALALLVIETGMFLILALSLARLALLAVFFVAVLGGGAFARAPSPLLRRGAVGVLLVLSAVLVCNYPGGPIVGWLRLPVPAATGPAADRFQPVSQVDHSMFRWMELETPQDAVFAGRFNVLPPVLAYADRAIVQHSKFEVPGVRSKVAAHFRAAFGSEDELAAFCDQHGAGYYLHDPFVVLGTGSDSARYMAGLVRVPKQSAAYALHFAPERLRRFELVYQNALYRVYRRTDEPEPFDVAKFPYQPIYDLDRFGGEDAGELFSDAATESVFDELQQGHDRLRHAVALFAAARWREALPVYREALTTNPSLPYAHSHSARILLNLGQLEEALGEAEQAVRVDPYEPEGWFHRAMVQWAMGDREAARQTLETCRRIDPAFPGLRQ